MSDTFKTTPTEIKGRHVSTSIQDLQYRAGSDKNLAGRALVSGTVAGVVTALAAIFGALAIGLAARGLISNADR